MLADGSYNKDGKINDGSELFGNNSVKQDGSKAANGFLALADIDSNGDGVIDVKDTAWNELQIMRWRDANGDGIKDDGEEYFVTLAQAGVKSLDVSYKDSTKVDKSGNEHRQVGSYTKTDGSTETMTDVWFVTATGETKYDRSGIPAHSAAIKGLPEIGGRGRLYSLRDAMALDDVKDSKGKSKLKTPYYGDNRTETRTLREMVSAFSSVAMMSDKEAIAEVAIFSDKMTRHRAKRLIDGTHHHLVAAT